MSLLFILSDEPDFASYFTIEFDMTSKGAAQRDEVIRATMMYLKMIEVAPDEQWKRIHTEVQFPHSTGFIIFTYTPHIMRWCSNLSLLKTL